MPYKSSRVQLEKEELIDVKKKLKAAQKELEDIKGKTSSEKAAEKRHLGLDGASKLQRMQLADCVALMNMPTHDKSAFALSLAGAMNLKGEDLQEFHDLCCRKLYLEEAS